MKHMKHTMGYGGYKGMYIYIYIHIIYILGLTKIIHPFGNGKHTFLKSGDGWGMVVYGIVLPTLSGWWYTYPSEKYESQLG